MADDTTRGVHLNEKQLVFVLMAAGVICGVMFLFGVLVGRGVQSERGPVADSAMIGATQVVPDQQPAADAAGTKPAGSPADDFSYPKRLSEPEAPAESLKAPAKAAASSPVVTPAGGATFIDVPQSPPDTPDDSPAAGRAEPTTSGPFSVQVAAVRKRTDADVVVKRLKAQGYDVRVVAPDPGDPTGVFRVKVGTYKTRREADVVARKIESEGPYKPWVTR
jgi:cell division septation protein DedD